VALDPTRFQEIHMVRPGITGLSQLAFASEARLLDKPDPMAYYIERLLPAKAELDVLYARSRTIVTDLSVLFWTAAALVGRREIAVWRDTGRMGVRRRSPERVPAPAPASRAVIFAGGVGTQLAPESATTARPLLPIGDRSPLEVVIDQVTHHGVGDITVYVGDLEHPIEAALAARGSDPRVRLVREEPRCTDALVRMVKDIDGPVLVINGDVLSSIDYTALIDHHWRSDNLITIAGHVCGTSVGFEVLRCDPATPNRLAGDDGGEDDPGVMVNAGIYVVEPRALSHLPAGEGFVFSDLIARLLAAGEPVGVYPYAGFWLDVSRSEGYQKAVETYAVAQVTPAVELAPAAPVTARV
jgi:dTDP-glucose pyrophosphorylase